MLITRKKSFSCSSDSINQFIFIPTFFIKGLFKFCFKHKSSFFQRCQESKAAPLFLLNCTKDNITYWDRDMNDTQGYGPYLSTQAMIDFRAKQNQCTLASTDFIGSPNAEDNTSIKIETYENKNSKNDIRIYTVINGGHGSPEYLDLGQEIWNFFSHYLE